MTWAQSDAISDVRKILSDGPTDKLRYRKQVLDIQNSSNVTFKTFEMRRITTFVGAVAPFGVYVNNTLVTVSSDNLATGEFVLAVAPANGDQVQATYYVQWFLDEEITQFLVSSAQWIGVADDYTAIGSDLRPAAKEYAASQAYQKLAAKFAENLAETFQLYDAPDEKRFNPITAYMNISKVKMELAFRLRDDVYKNRKGRALAPISVSIAGRVGNVTPNR